MSTSAELLALLAFALGGLLQSSTGYGFAVLASPVLAGVVAPDRAIPTLVVVGTLVNLFSVADDRRRNRGTDRPTADVPLFWAILLTSLPGVVAGTALLLLLPREALRALIAVAVLGAAFARLGRPTVVGPRRAETVVAGATSGLLGGAVGFNGPPLVLLLLRRGTPPDAARGTLAAFFTVSGVLTGATLVAAGAFDPIALTPWLLLVALLGQRAGIPLRPILAGRHEEASVAVLMLSGVVALVSAGVSLA